MVILATTLAERIENLLEAEETNDERYKEFFHKHFRAVLPDYWRTIEQERARANLKDISKCD